MVLKPAEGRGLFKRGGQIRSRVSPIPEVDRIAGAVFGITRRRRHLSSLRSRLIALGFDVKENTFLQSLGPITAQQPQINTIGCSRSTHGIERHGGITMQFNARLHWHQLINDGFRVREMTQQATITSWLFINACNHLGLGAEGQQFRKEQQRGQRQ